MMLPRPGSLLKNDAVQITARRSEPLVLDAGCEPDVCDALMPSASLKNDAVLDIAPKGRRSLIFLMLM
jgi:hypothetical protein